MTAIKSNQLDEDEIETEIPIYLAKSLNGRLHILQYPVRPASNNYDDDTILKVQIKPESNQLEMEIGLPTRVPTFDLGKGEQISLNVDGASKNNRDCEENFFKSNLMDKVILNSTNVLADPSRYAVAVMSNGSLHLTPVTSVMAMKPSFDYLDKADKRSKSDNKDGEEEEDGEPKERKLTVKFAGEETERSKKYREKSYNFLQKKIKAEPWIPLEYNRFGSKSSEFERDKLFCTHTTDAVDQFHLDEATYLQQLVPTVAKKIPEGLPTHMISNAELGTLPLPERLRAIMINACVASFSEILSSTNGSEQTVLKAVQQVAVLVKGNWVVQSDIVYPKEPKEEGVFGKETTVQYEETSEVLQRIRDYTLYFLNKNSTIHRTDICKAFDVSSSCVIGILKPIAKPVESGVWEFMLPSDVRFIKKFSDVSQRQDMIWQARFEQLSQYLANKDSQLPPTSTSQVQPNLATNESKRVNTL